MEENDTKVTTDSVDSKSETPAVADSKVDETDSVASKSDKEEALSISENVVEPRVEETNLKGDTENSKLAEPISKADLKVEESEAASEKASEEQPKVEDTDSKSEVDSSTPLKEDADDTDSKSETKVDETDSKSDSKVDKTDSKADDKEDSNEGEDKSSNDTKEVCETSSPKAEEEKKSIIETEETVLAQEPTTEIEKESGESSQESAGAGLVPEQQHEQKTESETTKMTLPTSGSFATSEPSVTSPMTTQSSSTGNFIFLKLN